MDSEPENMAAFLGSVEGELAFFRSLMRSRPVGMNRHFHVLSMRNAIHKDTGHWVDIEAIWEKLKGHYDLEALDAIDLEADGYESPGSSNSTPVSIQSPTPSQNLSFHPFFKEEYTLPFDQSFEALILSRRLRATPSPPSSPAPSAPAKKSRNGGKKRKGKSKLDLAGLIGGDSDSSALTQESGDEGLPATPRESVVTGTDAGTDYAEDEDVEMGEPSPGPSVSAKPRGRPKGSKKGVATSKTRAATSTARPLKKRKR